MSEAAHTDHRAGGHVAGEQGAGRHGAGGHQHSRHRRPRSLHRRGQLLDAADRIVMRDGPAASMNAIAAEAGITKPVLYRHFGDKSGLYRALAERHTGELLAEIRAALGAPGSRRARTESTIDAYLRVIERSPQTYRFLLHRASVEDPRVHTHVTLFVRTLGEELAGGIALELGLGPQQMPLACAWAHGIVGMVQGAGEWWLEHPEVPRSELVAQLTDLLHGAFAAYPQAALP